MGTICIDWGFKGLLGNLNPIKCHGFQEIKKACYKGVLTWLFCENGLMHPQVFQ